MSTQLVPFQKKVGNIRALLEKSKPQLAIALPKHLSVDRMMRIAMTSIQKTPELVDCTPNSLIGAIMQASQLGLEPDGLLGQAYLIPYKHTCTLIPGYKGLIKLARNSGELATIQEHVVHERDLFEFCLGDSPSLTHKPTSDEDPGAVIAFYAVARLKDGAVQFEVMYRREVDAIRKQSRASGTGPWVTHYEEMGKKTVLRRLCKMLPSSIELQKAVTLDEQAEAGIAQDIDTVIDLSTPDSNVDAAPVGGKLDELMAGQTGDAA